MPNAGPGDHAVVLQREEGGLHEVLALKSPQELCTHSKVFLLWIIVDLICTKIATIKLKAPGLIYTSHPKMTNSHSYDHDQYHNHYYT